MKQFQMYFLQKALQILLFTVVDSTGITDSELDGKSTDCTWEMLIWAHLKLVSENKYCREEVFI